MFSFVRITSISILPVLALFACSEGGEEDRPQSTVRIEQVHHAFGLVGRPSFAQFPVQQSDVGTVTSTMKLFDTSVYDIPGALAQQQYFLEETGHMSFAQARNQASTLIYRGGYGLQGSTRNFFFTDRVGSAVGLFVGSPFVAGTPDIAALSAASPRWHVLSMHVMFEGPNTPKSVHGVGRSFAGMVDLASDGKLSGDGFESLSPSAALPVTGTLGGFEDGYSLNLSYGTEGREFEGGGDHKLLLGLDNDRTDGAAGMMAMMRRLDVAPDLASLEGKYILGLWTIFLDPDNSGFDSAVGSLEISANGDYRISAVNARGIDFSYTGKVTPSTVSAEFGRLSFTVPKTNETWLGAVTEDKNTLILVDNVVEARSSGQSELNFIVALREDSGQ